MTQLHQFVARLLEQGGALVEHIEPEGLEVLAPPSVQTALHIPELSRLGFGATLPAGAQRLSLESDWIERLAGLLGEQGRWMRRIVKPANPPPGSPERILQHSLELLNATYRLQGAYSAWTRYVILRFRYTALSDEKRDGLLHLGFNLWNGATLDEWLEDLCSAVIDDPSTARQAPLPTDVRLPTLWE